MTIIFIIRELWDFLPTPSISKMEVGFTTPHSVGERRGSLVIWTLVDTSGTSMVIVYITTMSPAIVGIGPASFGARFAFAAFSASTASPRAFTSRLGSSSGQVADALFEGGDDALLFQGALGCGHGAGCRWDLRGDRGVFEVR